MSLFLGKIHYWLYNKIIWFEAIENEIIGWAKVQGLSADEWKRQADEEFGMATDRRPLEEVIDTSNIHGWLQQKIQSAELRQAYLVTKILAESPKFKQDLAKIYAEKGEETASADPNGKVDTAEIAYKALDDLLLEGMPCDRVNEVLSVDSSEVVWRTTECLHTPYWNKVGGNVQNFYDLREEWIKAFIKRLNPNFNYEKVSEDTQRIIKH